MTASPDIRSSEKTEGTEFLYLAGFPVVDGLVQRILMLVALHLWREVRKEKMG